MEVEARRVRRQEAVVNGASRGYLDGGRSSLAVLDFENPRYVSDSDRRRASKREGAEHEGEKNNGGKLRVHGWRQRE